MKLPSLRTTNEMRLDVELGRVMCPRRGDLDVEWCLLCDHALDADLDGPQPAVRCAYGGRPVADVFVDLRFAGFGRFR